MAGRPKRRARLAVERRSEAPPPKLNAYEQRERTAELMFLRSVQRAGRHSRNRDVRCPVCAPKRCGRAP